MELKKKETAFNWSFLRQHIANMSDVERTRQEMYDKYLYNPTSWTEGLSHYPEHLLAKNRVLSRPHTVMGTTGIPTVEKKSASDKRSVSRAGGECRNRLRQNQMGYRGSCKGKNRSLAMSTF